MTFTQGEADKEGIIAGIEIATKKMKKGECDQLTISAKYGYGDAGCPELNIPPNATLDYEVEMISFEKVRTEAITISWTFPPMQPWTTKWRWSALKRYKQKS